MNGWLAAAAILLLGLAPVGAVCARGSLGEAVVALELAGTVGTLVLLLLAEGFHRQPFVDLAVVLGALSFVGDVVFLRYLERHG